MGFLPEDLQQRLTEVVEQRGFVLLDLKQRGERGSTVLEVVADAKETDIGLDDLTELSRTIGALLDEFEERLPSRYRLEVSSAGLGRPLEHDWQFRKNIGRLVKLTFEDEGGVVRNELFRLVDASHDALTVGPKKKGKGEETPTTIPIGRIRRAVIEPEL